MKRIIILSSFLCFALAMGLGIQAAQAVDSICLTQQGDDQRTSDEDYDCVVQLRELLKSRGLLQVQSKGVNTNKALYYPPTPNRPYYPPTPNLPYYPPTPNFPTPYGYPPTPN